LNIESKTAKAFVAHGRMVQGDSSAKIIVSGTIPLFGKMGVKCTIAPLEGQRFSGIRPDNLLEPIKISGTTEEGDDIHIEGLFVERISFSQNQTHWVATADRFMKGKLQPFGDGGEEITCYATVTPTLLASSDSHYERWYDGTIRFGEGTNRNGLHWSTRLGEAKLIDNYTYIDDTAGIDKVDVRIQQCQVTIQTNKSHGASLGEILGHLPAALDEALQLISLLSRRRVSWYKAEAVMSPKKATVQPFQSALVIRRQFQGHEPLKEMGLDDMLILPEKLKPDLFQELLSNYVKSRQRNLMKQIMPHLLAAYEGGYVEASISRAYLGIETLVYGIASDEHAHEARLVDYGVFQKMIPDIKAVISGHISDSTTARAIIGNIERLNKAGSNRSFTDRLWSILMEHDVPYNLLWPTDSDIPLELRQMRKRRDVFIHQGKTENLGQYYADALRWRNLTELCILKLLDCPREVINQMSLGHRGHFDFYGLDTSD